MTAPRRALALRIAAGAVVCLTLVFSPVALAAEEASIHYTEESLAQYEQQLNSGQVKSVTINKRLRSLRVTLKDGSYFKARYKAKGEPEQTAKLQAKHVPFNILTPTEAEAEAKKVQVHHKLRYIAGGALLVLIVLVGGVLYMRRRREEDE
jgi:ATP-dependent Zn protease